MITDVSPGELQLFLRETEEQLQLLDENIVRMEKGGGDPGLIEEVFRVAHTLKGSSAMLGYAKMTELTHAMENLLDDVRKGSVPTSSDVVDVLLASLDGLRELKQDLVASRESNLDIGPVVASLESAGARGGDGRRRSGAGSGNGSLVLGPEAQDSLRTALAAGHKVHRVDLTVEEGSSWAAVRCFQVLDELGRLGTVIGSKPSQQDIEQEQVGSKLELVVVSSEDEQTIRSAVAAVPEVVLGSVRPYVSGEAGDATGPSVIDERIVDMGPGARGTSAEELQEIAAQKRAEMFETVRIGVRVLDNLVDMVGELVLDNNTLAETSKVLESRYERDELVGALAKTSAHIAKIVNGLQTEIMQVRMLPIGTLFGRFPRMVRDLARKAEKRLDFQIEGEDTELDRTLIEQIYDPLVHLLRNAVDHGVEPPEERRAAGKPETARIRLSACHEQGRIVITLEDDGKGIDPRGVRDAAVRKGFVSAEEAARLAEAEALDLIFRPGMSTARKATEVSGRGVGLDIVRTNIEGLSGAVIMESELGRGTTFTINLPLTVAIIHGIMALCGGSVYAIPMVSVLEVVKLAREEVSTVRGAEVIRVRDRIVPLIRLGKSLWLDAAQSDSDEGFAVVVNAGESQVGVAVDSLMEPQEFVVKPLGRHLGDVKGIAGATIMGDGRVALILDIGGIVRMAV